MAHLWERGVVVRSCGDWIQGQRELVVPAELKTSLAEFTVPVSSSWVALGQVSCMGSDLVCNHTLRIVADTHSIVAKLLSATQ